MNYFFIANQNTFALLVTLGINVHVPGIYSFGLLIALLDIRCGAEVVRQSSVASLHSDGAGVCSDVRRSTSLGLHLAQCLEQ